MAHTPEVWEYRKAGSSIQRINGDDVMHNYPDHVVAISFDAEGRRVTSFVCTCESATLDNAANARRISAVPDMLEALKSARLYVHVYVDHASRPDVLRQIDLAIAKAERK